MASWPGSELIRMIEARFGRRAVTPTLALLVVAMPLALVAIIAASLAAIWTLFLSPIALVVAAWIGNLNPRLSAETAAAISSLVTVMVPALIGYALATRTRAVRDTVRAMTDTLRRETQLNSAVADFTMNDVTRLLRSVERIEERLDRLEGRNTDGEP